MTATKVLELITDLPNVRLIIPFWDEADAIFRQFQFDVLVSGDTDAFYCSPVYVNPNSLQLFSLTETQRLGMKMTASWYGKNDLVLPTDEKRRFKRNDLDDWMENPEGNDDKINNYWFRNTYKVGRNHLFFFDFFSHFSLVSEWIAH